MDSMLFVERLELFNERFNKFDKENFKHPNIVKFLFCTGRDIEKGTNGVESEKGGNPFVGKKSSILMKVLWLIKMADGEFITHREMSHYLGNNEGTICSALSKVKETEEFKKIIFEECNGARKYKCIDKDAFPEKIWDEKGYEMLAKKLLKGVVIAQTKENKPIIQYNSHSRYTTKIAGIISWIKFCDGDVIDDKNLYEYGITVPEIAENLGCEEWRVKDDLKRIKDDRILGEFIECNKIENQNGKIEERYYVNSNGRCKTVKELKLIANDRFRKLTEGPKSKEIAKI